MLIFKRLPSRNIPNIWLEALSSAVRTLSVFFIGLKGEFQNEDSSKFLEILKKFLHPSIRSFSLSLKWLIIFLLLLNQQTTTDNFSDSEIIYFESYLNELISKRTHMIFISFHFSSWIIIT